MIFENGGVLYSGPKLTEPRRVWDYSAKRWVTFHGGSQEEGFGTPVGRMAARKLKYDSPGAAHYMYYDEPPWSQPLSDAYRESLRPEHVKKRIVEVAAERAKRASGS